MPKKGLISKIEQSIYFRIARVFAWLVATFCTIGFIYSGINIAIIAPKVLGESAKVSPEEIRIAIERKSNKLVQYEVKSEAKRINLELLAKLDKEIYKRIYLLPEDKQFSEWKFEIFKA